MFLLVLRIFLFFTAFRYTGDLVVLATVCLRSRMASAAGKIIVYHDEQKAQLLLDGLLHKSDKEQKQQRQEEEQGLW